MISWKYSLEKINGELELARKKKQALDKLFSEGKVSQPTYDLFNGEVANAIGEIEAKQKMIVEKMEAKISELEQQIKTLEFLLVNSEIRHVSGEVEEEAYNRECNVLSLGLETTRQELNEIKEAIANINEQTIELPPPPPPPQATEETPKEESETEKRLEIVMDTETTTSIETTVEEPPKAEEKVEVIVEEGSEQEAKTEPPKEEVAEDSFRQDESPQSGKADTQEASGGEKAA